MHAIDLHSTWTAAAVLVAVALVVWADGFDRTVADDHDQTFDFGQRPNALRPSPFTAAQYARLLLLRSRWQDGLLRGDGCVSKAVPKGRHCSVHVRID